MAINITEPAAAQIKKSAQEAGNQGTALRIAAKRNPDGSIDYAMGFDSPEEVDTRLDINGVDLLVAPTSSELLEGVTLDFVELNPGEPQFIFMNPNDPTYVAPESSD